jgi:hypothetical protein
VSVSFRDHTLGAVAALEGEGLLVGQGQAPPGGGWQGTPGQSAFVPYVIVWPIAGSTITGSLGAPDDYASAAVQITAVGPTQEGAERAGDRAQAALLAGFAVTGRHVLRVHHESSLGVHPDLDLSPTVWTARDRYRIESTPA